MRDALSILDKIVSFTGGKIEYANTLEHLNILDEDYYFRLLEHMQQEQLADAMLLFDEINQKGFEGDTLLDGFAEFIRNLLVCKDPKAAVLLEVADGFRQKYLQHAAMVDTGWLIAALNIISDAVINYKQSRNKKLHIELLLIKLTYLHQALQLSVAENGLSKKKLTDNSKALSFRSVGYIAVPTAPLEQPVAKLVIETPVPAPVTITTQPKPVAAPATTVGEKANSKLGSLSKIRQQVARNNNNGDEAKPLNSDSLLEAWNLFIEKLAARKNHSAVTNFKLASLSIIDQQCFEITTASNIQQKFIEAERSDLIAHMQEFFRNRFLKYQLKLEETVQVTETEDRPMSAKMQYQQLSEQYPMIKELRDRLKLDLD